MTVPLPESQTSTVQVFVNTGSLYEKPAENGLAHFLEHLCFKGTPTRSRIDIMNTLDGMGAETNAFTSHEYTSYYAKAPSKHFDTVIDIISDLYLNPTIPEAEMETERGVILGEIDMYEDLPMREVPYILNELLYGDQPAGWRILGPKSIIKSVQRSEILKFRSRWYQASNTMIVVAGPHTHAEVTAKVKKLFKDIESEPVKTRSKIRLTAKESSIRVKEKQCDQAHLVVGFPTFGANHDERSALSVLGALLGNGMSSRLFNRIREQMGAGYYVRSDFEQFRETGYMAVLVGTEAVRVPEVLSAILDECMKIFTEEISKEEFKKAKNIITGRAVMGFEGSDAYTNYYGALYSLGLPFETPAQHLKEIQSVTIEQVQKLAKKIFKLENTYVAAVGKGISEKDIEKVLKN